MTTTNTTQLKYAIIQTINGNYRLKTLAKAEKACDSIEMELYGNTLDAIKCDYKAHMNELKELGFL
jgi:histone acetyltransferase (RNA polymerase elongator complex component)